MKRLTCKFTKVITLTLVAVMLLSVAMPMAVAWNLPNSTNRFDDVPDYPNWQNNPVSWAYRNNITRGTELTTFSPNDPVTRAQFVTFFHRMYRRPAAPAAAFADMPGSTDFQAAISWALNEGITRGITDTTFGPERPIRRDELAAMLHRHIAGGVAAPDVLHRYTDQGSISTWDGARAAVNWAAYHGIMGLDSTVLNPRGNATRAETVAMLYRVVTTFNLPSPIPAPPPPAEITVVLYEGIHIVGQDIPAGRYTAIPVCTGEINRNVGSIAVNSSPHAQFQNRLIILDILSATYGQDRWGTADLFGSPSVTVSLYDGDTIRLWGLVGGVSFGPPVTPPAGTLSAGRWIVGEHIAPGQYRVTYDQEGFTSGSLPGIAILNWPGAGQIAEEGGIASSTTFGATDVESGEVVSYFDVTLQHGQEILIKYTCYLTFTPQ